MDIIWMYLIYLNCIHILFVSLCRNQPVLLKTTSSLVWSWRLWTGRTPTWFVPPQWERLEVRRSSSCLTAGEAPLTTGARSTLETSSPSAGVRWRNTVYSPLETSVSTALILTFFVMCGGCSLFWQISIYENSKIPKFLIFEFWANLCLKNNRWYTTSTDITGFQYKVDDVIIFWITLLHKFAFRKDAILNPY